MPKYIPGITAIAVCARSGFKVPYKDLVEDPNFPGLWVRKADCDVFDPYRLPPREPEHFTLDHPRPDALLSGSTVSWYWDTDFQWDTNEIWG